jgi:hypothetical protein
MDVSVALIQPIIILVIWSMVMWLWMYATRIPAITSMKMTLDPNAPSGSQMSQLPAKVRWKADNYNHLMEQPTIFYATALCLAVLGVIDESVIYAAWGYVALRVIHSLIQALTNKIEVRFALFILSNIPLIFLIYHAVIAAF